MPSNDKNLPVSFLDRLSTKIIITAVVFLFAMSAAVVFQVETGFRRNQHEAYVSSQSVLKNQIEQEYVQSTAYQARLLELHLHETAVTAQSAARMIEVQLNQNPDGRLDEDLVKAYFQKLRAQAPQVAEFFYIDPQLQVLTDRSDFVLPADHNWIPVTGQYFLSDKTNAPLPILWQSVALNGKTQLDLIAQAPVFVQGQYRGLVAASLPLTHLSEQLEQFQQATGQSYYLIDDSGQIISSTPGADRFSSTIAQSATHLPAQENAVEKLDLNGKQVLLISIPLANPALRLVQVIPQETIVQQAQTAANTVRSNAEQTLRSTLTMVFIFFLLGLLGTLIALNRLFTHRVARLVQGVNAITEGNLDVSVPDTDRDELGILGRSFNSMTRELKQRRNRLRESEAKYRALAESLEVRVKESTQEIQTLYDQASTRSHELELLYQADEQLYRHLHLDDVLQALVDVVVDQLEADKSSILVWDDIEQRLVLRGARGFSARGVARLASYQPGDGLAWKVFQTGQVMTVDDASNAPPPANQIAAEEGVCSFVSVPIQIKDKVFGVFVMNYEQPHEFTPGDIRLCQSLAQRAAIAIENARLYEKAEQAATLEERQRLARELHDAITQSLYSLVLLAEAGRRYAVAGNTEQVEHHLSRLGETAQQALKEMRLLVYELRPLALIQEGLDGAIRRRLDTVEKRSGVQARLTTEGRMNLPPQIEEQVYRITQEALNNALKHAHARSVSVTLRRRAQEFELEVFDDGQGFDPQENYSEGIGLSSMRERTARMSGDLSIEAAPGRGTCVRVRIPLNEINDVARGVKNGRND